MELNVSIENIHAFVLEATGHHGSCVALFHGGGIPITELLPPDRIKALEDRPEAAEPRLSAFSKQEAPITRRLCAVEMAEAILKDKKKILPVPPIWRRIRNQNLFIGVPVKLDQRVSNRSLRSG